MLFPALSEQTQTRISTETFAGYDHRQRILPGSWYEETNLTAAHYPLFSQRRERGFIKVLEQPQGMLAKDALMYIDGSSVYYNDLPVSGIRLSTDADMLPKQLVSMGAYAVIFPDKVYINTADLSDCGSLENRYDAGSLGVSLTMCRIDGSEYDLDAAAIAPESPKDPANGDLWIDNSSDTHQLRQYSAAAATWVDILTVYIKIAATGIHNGFSVDDGVSISGISEANEQLKALNGDHIIKAIGDNYIVIVGMLDKVHSQSGGLVVTRECPDMDYVTESNNRIWGCKYGFVDGQTLNEIYACKLGDPKNWRCYAGLSTDSYAVSVGTDGKFTGAITHLGYPLFFKEHGIHKIYGSMPSNYQMVNTSCRGVQDGSWRSLCVVNETLYYLSRTDVCAYDGSLPVGVSDTFGGEKYFDGVAGSDGSEYYLSVRDDNGAYSLFVLDTERGIWHRQDDTKALCFANVRGDLRFIDADSGKMISVKGHTGEAEGDFEWSAISGILQYEYPHSLYLNRFSLRVKLGAGAELNIALEYDSEGGWVDMGSYSGNEIMRTVSIPVIPRRCDHMRMRLSGHGDIKIYSINRYLEGGSDVWQ